MYRLKNVLTRNVVLKILKVPNDGEEISFGIDQRYNYEILEAKKKIWSVLETSVTGKVGGANVITTTVCMQAEFSYEGGETMKVEDFAQKNAMGWLFPFTRERIANLTNGCPFETVFIPSMNVVSIVNSRGKFRDESLKILRF